MGWFAGDSYSINLGGHHFDPFVVTLPDGRLALVWTQQRYFVATFNLLVELDRQINGAMINPDGTLGTRFTVDSSIGNDNSVDSFQISVGDRFLVTWTERATGADGLTDVRAQIYQGNAGVAFGTQIAVATTTTGAQSDSAAAYLSNDNFVITWTDASATVEDTSGTAIRGQLFSNAGFKIGSEFLANTITSGNQNQSDVTQLADGRFVVDWTDLSKSNDGVNNVAFRAQVFNADGTRSGAERALLTGATLSDAPSLEANGKGGFFFEFQSGSLTLRKIFNSTGALQSTIIVKTDDNPAIALPDGRFFRVILDPDAPGTVVITVLTEQGEQSGITIPVGTSQASPTGSFLYAIPLPNGLLATFRQSFDEVGILRTPTGDIITTVIDLKRYDGTAAAETVVGGNFDDELSGAGGDDLLSGRGGNDTLKGGGGSDTIGGDDGDDIIKSGAANDILIGGDGNDTLVGGNGNDGLDGGGGDDTLNGGSGNDTQGGDTGDDRVIGGGGGDHLTGGLGNDTVNGGAGNDTYHYSLGDGTDRIFDLGGAADTLVVEALSDIASSVRVGNNLVLRFTGGGQITVIKHFIIANQVESIADADGQVVVLAAGTIGGPASGIVSGTNDADYLDGKGGDDFLFGAGGNDLLLGGSGMDRLFGGAGKDTVVGGSSDDKLFGEDGNDLLRGGRGNDLLVGGRGGDILKGNAGSDAFDFNGTSDSGAGDKLHDRIIDFTQGEDVIDLADIDAISGGGDDAFTFIGNSALGAAGELRAFTTSGGRTLIEGDVDGSGADFQIVLLTNVALSAGDFVL